MSQFHPYHLVEPSPWPLVGSLGGVLGLVGMGIGLHGGSFSSWLWGVGVLTLVVVGWWRDIGREASYVGDHGAEVEWNMRWGMILFITSEVLFFFSFFWTYFHMGLSATLEVGVSWPPAGVYVFDPVGVPLLNTIILLGSGVFSTYAHHAILRGYVVEGLTGIVLTVILGVYFLWVQLSEYVDCSFSIGDSNYGSVYFIATGFHGLHVLIGVGFLSVIALRMGVGSFTPWKHFGMEAGIWYWHFVDVVWIALFLFVYVWGG